MILVGAALLVAAGAIVAPTVGMAVAGFLLLAAGVDLSRPGR
jgi:hypothetical protein